MSRFFKFLLIILASTLLQQKFAHSGYGVAGGLNYNFGSNTNSTFPLNTETNPALSFSFGGFYHSYFDSFRLRVHGLIRTVRLRNEVAGFNLTFYALQAAVPVLLQYPISENFSLLGGGDVSFNLRNDASFNSDPVQFDFPSTVINATVGVSYRLTKKLSAEVVYSHGLTDIAKNVNHSFVGFQFVTYLGRIKKIK